MFDLMYYGGFSYSDVLALPLFIRDYYHDKVKKAYENECQFQMSLHGMKKD